jgi:hypothetical protein
VPVEDMTALQEQTDLDGAPRSSIWPAVEERVLDLIEAHRLDRSSSPTPASSPSVSARASTSSPPAAPRSGWSLESARACPPR